MSHALADPACYCRCHASCGPAVRRAFEASLSGAERAHLDQLRRLYGGGS